MAHDVAAHALSRPLGERLRFLSSRSPRGEAERSRRSKARSSGRKHFISLGFGDLIVLILDELGWNLLLDGSYLTFGAGVGIVKVGHVDSRQA
jgi:hypothetical protein